MAQVFECPYGFYDSYELVTHALATLNLKDKLPKFKENEVTDSSVEKNLADTAGIAALPGILCIVSIPAGRVHDFISAFKAALEHRKEVRLANAALNIRAEKLIPSRKKNAGAKRSSDVSPLRKRGLTLW